MSVFSWGFCKMWQWFASTSRVYVIREHPKAEDGRRRLLRKFSDTAQYHGLPKKSENKITFPAYLCGFPTLTASQNSGTACSSSIHDICLHKSGYIWKINLKLPARFAILIPLPVFKKGRPKIATVSSHSAWATYILLAIPVFILAYVNQLNSYGTPLKESR